MQQPDNKIYDCRHKLKVTGNALLFNGDTLAIYISENGLTATEIRSIHIGAVQYGLFLRDHIPFLLIGIAGLQFDFIINGFSLVPMLQRRRLKSYSGRVSFAIVLPGTNKMVTERTFPFNPPFTDHVKSCIEQQWRYYHAEADVRKRANELTEFLVTKDMFKESKLYRYPV